MVYYFKYERDDKAYRFVLLLHAAELTRVVSVSAWSCTLWSQSTRLGLTMFWSH